MDNSKEKMNFYEKGDIVYLELKITDEKKSFELFAKSLTGRESLSDKFGFEIEGLIPSKQKFDQNISDEIKHLIKEKLQNAVDEISKLL